MTFKQAQRELAAAVAEAGSQKQVAKAIGCNKAHLSLVLAGEKTFGTKFIFRIQKLFGIPATAWRRPVNARRRAA